MGGLVILDAEQTARKLPFDGLVEALRHGFIEGCHLPERHHHTLSRAGELDATLLLMPAWTDPGKGRSLLGVKLVTVVPGNAARNLPGLVSTYILFDGLTGEQLALMDGNTITGRRTAATSALAASYLSRPDSSKLLVIGAGRVGSLIPEAYKAVRPIEMVTVWDINPDAAHRLTSQLVEQGFQAKVTDDLEQAVRSADIISTATLATTPIIKGAWLQPGTHVDLIGAFTPQMREADDDVIRLASLYIDTTEAFHEAGDIVQPIDDGIISKEAVRATLAQLCKASQPARSSKEEITCFKAVGSGLADLAAAEMVYSRP